MRRQASYLEGESAFEQRRQALRQGPLLAALQGQGPWPPLRNDLQTVVEPEVACVREGLDLLRQAPGSVAVAMSGSGPSLFALFSTVAKAERALEHLATPLNDARLRGLVLSLQWLRCQPGPSRRRRTMSEPEEVTPSTSAQPRKGPLSFLSGALTSALLGWLSLGVSQRVVGYYVDHPTQLRLGDGPEHRHRCENPGGGHVLSGDLQLWLHRPGAVSGVPAQPGASRKRAESLSSGAKHRSSLVEDLIR